MSAGGSRPQDLAERAVAAAGPHGCVVLVRERSAVNLRWAGNTLTTNGDVRDQSVTVVVTTDSGTGTAAGVVGRSGVGPDDVTDLVGAATAAAAGNGPAEDAAPLVDGSSDGGEHWQEAPEATSAAVFDRLAPDLGEAFRRATAESRELFGFAEHEVTTTYLASSTGLRLRHAQPAGRVELTGKGDGRTTSTWVGAATRDFADVDVTDLDAEVAARLAWQRRTVEVPPGRYDTVLPPSAVADLMVYLYWCSAARDAADGRTVFSAPGGGTRLGDRLATAPVTLWSDPADPTLACLPFVTATSGGSAASVFDNGLPLHATRWIDDGVLSALLQTRATAARTGQPVTPGIDNLLLRVGDAAGTLDELVAGTAGRALLLTCLWYIREVDPQTLLLTGLTRDGVYVVEDGEVVGATTNFRFNESPVDLLGRIAAAGAAEPTLPREWADYFTRTAMPALRVEEFNMSSVSQAS